MSITRLLALGATVPLWLLPAHADVPYDGWRGQRAGASQADRRPLDDTPRYGATYTPPRAARGPSRPDYQRPALWSGFYGGASLAGGWGSADIDATTTGSVTLDGFGGGLHAGYNLQHGALVAGLEADVGLTSIDGTRHDWGTAVAATASLDWLASVRGRLGFAWDNLLVYGTAGIAFSGLDLDVTAGGATSSTRETLTGLVWGGGIEMRINPQLSARVEALRYNFDEEHIGSAVGSLAVGADVTQVRAGLSWHFN